MATKKQLLSTVAAYKEAYGQEPALELSVLSEIIDNKAADDNVLTLIHNRIMRDTVLADATEEADEEAEISEHLEDLLSGVDVPTTEAPKRVREFAAILNGSASFTAAVDEAGSIELRRKVIAFDVMTELERACEEAGFEMASLPVPDTRGKDVKGRGREAIGNEPPDRMKVGTSVESFFTAAFDATDRGKALVAAMAALRKGPDGKARQVAKLGADAQTKYRTLNTRYTSGVRLLRRSVHLWHVLDELADMPGITVRRSTVTVDGVTRWKQVADPIWIIDPETLEREAFNDMSLLRFSRQRAVEFYNQSRQPGEEELSYFQAVVKAMRYRGTRQDVAKYKDADTAWSNLFAFAAFLGDGAMRNKLEAKLYEGNDDDRVANAQVVVDFFRRGQGIYNQAIAIVEKANEEADVVEKVEQQKRARA
jgi:hypothetical protein